MARIKDRLAALLTYIFAKDRQENRLSDGQKMQLHRHVQLQLPQNKEYCVQMQKEIGEIDHDGA